MGLTGQGDLAERPQDSGPTLGAISLHFKSAERRMTTEGISHGWRIEDEHDFRKAFTETCMPFTKVSRRLGHN